jgi:thiopeptide-type bacteriocin biosynthesis protein
MMQRIFIPGDEWLYIKLYSGEKTIDDILIKLIGPIVKELKDRKCLKKWFFIRYADPYSHLRIRILINDTRNFDEIIFLFNQRLQSWIKNHLIWNVQLETYNRELERYFRGLIVESESIFFYDSECILAILKKINGNEDYRWMITLKLIDELLSSFSCKVEEKIYIMEQIAQSYKIEFGFNELYLKQFNIKYRKNKNIVCSVLNNTFNDEKFIMLFCLIKKRTMNFRPVIVQIKSKLKNNSETSQLIKSYLHMMVNRIFLSENRIHEMILSDFMYRYYSSEIAKKKYNK